MERGWADFIQRAAVSFTRIEGRLRSQHNFLNVQVKEDEVQGR